MKKLLVVPLLLSSLSFASDVQTGVNAIVCRDTLDEIKSVEVFDVYQGRIELNLKIKNDSLPLESRVQKVINQIGHGRDQSFFDLLNFNTQFVINTKDMLGDGENISKVPHINKFSLQKGCQIETISNLTLDNRVLINGSIWNHLDQVNQAATILHMALYLSLKPYGDNYITERTSQIVANGLAHKKSIQIKDGVPANALTCLTPSKNKDELPSMKFWAYNNQEGELIFQFDYLNSRAVLTKTQLVIDKVSMNDLDQAYSTHYMIHIESNFENLIPMSISFEKKLINGEYRSVKTIGFTQLPLPKKEFYCF